MRADARRGYDRIVAAAESLVAEHGAEAPLEEIARHAGVGSATLHRRFPSRQLLLEAVFKGRGEALCAKAHGLLPAPDPGAALVTWLRAVANRGLGASLMHGARDSDPSPGTTTCHAMITSADDELLDRAPHECRTPRRPGRGRPAARPGHRWGARADTPTSARCGGQCFLGLADAPLLDRFLLPPGPLKQGESRARPRRSPATPNITSEGKRTPAVGRSS
jgi:AcrR family transcriptional regulator